mmetsp:Transcript_526/g.1249  ORF Transcript_526/g.1249 Transcript_526/m.1249 type:complete len:130 (-) Transcript_526:13-402(-)
MVSFAPMEAVAPVAAWALLPPELLWAFSDRLPEAPWRPMPMGGASALNPFLAYSALQGPEALPAAPEPCAALSRLPLLALERPNSKAQCLLLRDMRCSVTSQRFWWDSEVDDVCSGRRDWNDPSKPTPQ